MLIEDYQENYITGWVKLFRSFSKWEWYKNSKMVHLFLHLLISANHKEMKWQGQIVKRGQLVTGLHSLNQQTNISMQSIRTCLNKLKSTNEITIKSSNKNSIITIINYDLYQSLEVTNKQTNKQLTNDQQTTNKQTNKQLTTNKNDKKIKNDKKYRSFKHLSISDNEVSKLIDSGFSVDKINNILDQIENYNGNKKYTSLYLTALNWLKKEKPTKKIDPWL